MAKLPSLKLNISKSSLGKILRNLNWLFFAFFLLTLVWEVLVVKNSLNVIFSLNQQPVVESHDKGVRINFDDYNQIVARIKAAPDYTPTNPVIKDPFNPPPAAPPPSVPTSTPPTK